MKEILITSSVLIVVLLLLRVIFAKKVSRVLIYGAWALVALRLLIPVQIGELTGLAIAKNYIKPFGTIFLNLLKFVVVPIVLFSIASGVISMEDVRKELASRHVIDHKVKQEKMTQ